METATQKVSHLTFGQLSVLRSLGTIAKGREENANVSQAWPVSSGIGIQQVRESLVALVQRHESLRCIYDLSRPDEPKQIIQTFPQGNISLAATTREDASSRIGEIVEAERSKPFDITANQPWKMWIVHEEGEVCQVLLIMHHIAVDAASLDILKRDFYRLVSRLEMPAIEYTPTQFASDQNSTGWTHRRLRSAAYLKRMTEKVGEPCPPDPAHEASAVAGTFTSRPLKGAVEQRASEAGVSESSVVLAAYSLAIHHYIRPANVPLNIASSNRHLYGTADLVGSINQWVPLICDPLPVEDIGSYSRRIQKMTFAAYQNGCYHPSDLLSAMQRTRFRNNHLLPGYYFNFIERPFGESDSRRFDARHGEIIVRAPKNVTGPSFYLVVESGREMQIAFRAMWNEFNPHLARDFISKVCSIIDGE